MTNGFDREPDEQDVRAALQDALRDRFDGVDWNGLHDRIAADAAAWQASPQRPADVLAAWSTRGAAAAGALLAAGVAALLLLSNAVEADAVPPGFWPVAEELMTAVPDDTRLLIDAGTDMDGLLRLLLAEAGEEMDTR